MNDTRLESVDVLVPVFNEEDCLDNFASRLIQVMQTSCYAYSVLFIDDGSTDSSLPIIRSVCARYPCCGYASLSRNFGKEAAMTAGISFSRADALVIIDADLQDPPELIPRMLQLLEEEKADVVYAKRRCRRGEFWLKRWSAAFFYRVFDRFSRFAFPRDTGDFRVIRRRVVCALQELGEANRFMKGLFAWVGYRQVPFLYDRDPRQKGKSKFSFLSLLNFALDGITAFTIIPIQLATYLGLLFALLAILYGLFFMVKTLVWGDPVQGFPTLIIALSFFSGVQLMFLGIIGEYVARTNIEAKNRPLYLIDEKVLPVNRTNGARPEEKGAVMHGAGL